MNNTQKEILKWCQKEGGRAWLSSTYFMEKLSVGYDTVMRNLKHPVVPIDTCRFCSDRCSTVTTAKEREAKPKTHVLAISYKPKLFGVLCDDCHTDIRPGAKIQVGDFILWHGWSGTPFRSKWSWRMKVRVTQVRDILIADRGINFFPQLTPPVCLPWDHERVNRLAEVDGIKPATGEALKQALGQFYPLTKEPQPFQIIRWEIVEMYVPYFNCMGCTLRFKKPLPIAVKCDLVASKMVYILTNDDLKLIVVEELLIDGIIGIWHELFMLWCDYVIALGSELSPGAVALRKKLMGMVVRV